MGTVPAQRVLDLAVDLRLTLAPLLRGRGDPTMRFGPDGVWRASHTPEGPATVRLQADRGRVSAQAWGPGRHFALDQLPQLLGAADDDSGFVARHDIVAILHRRLRGLRIGRTGAVFDTLVPTVLEQKVAGLEARRSYSLLVRAHGCPAPGPSGLLLPPAPAALAALPYYALHPLGIERRRAEVIRGAAASAARLEEAAGMSSLRAQAHLASFPGIGAWTAAEVALRALGDADAVSVGDYHLPHQVAWALAGEPRGTDQRMLELLEPYRPHRGRVIRLLESAAIHAPRRGPRALPRSIAAR